LVPPCDRRCCFGLWGVGCIAAVRWPAPWQVEMFNRLVWNLTHAKRSVARLPTTMQYALTERRSAAGSSDGLALGDAEFASAAWDALPAPIRHRIDGRHAIFDCSARKRALTLTQAEIDRYPPVRHSIVRTHPYTARKCLYVMRDDCVRIEGVDQKEAEALIAALADHIVKPACIYRHQWRPDDLLMWDNCTVQHRAHPGLRHAVTAANAPHVHGRRGPDIDRCQCAPA
jgi:alpha-ketoglutarate-dependent taurine dioxygenase